VEGRNVGKVDTETYRIYARAWGALYILPILMLLLAVTERSFYGLQNWWLSVWSNANAATVVSWRLFPAACVLAMSLRMGSHRHCECLTAASQSEVKRISAAVAGLVPFFSDIHLTCKIASKCLNPALITCTTCYGNRSLCLHGISSMFSVT